MIPLICIVAVVTTSASMIRCQFDIHFSQEKKNQPFPGRENIEDVLKVVTVYFVRYCLTTKERCIGALSCSRMQLFVLHFSRDWLNLWNLFPEILQRLVESLRRRRISPHAVLSNVSLRVTSQAKHFDICTLFIQRIFNSYDATSATPN